MYKSIKFMRGWGKLMAQKERRDFKVAKLQVEVKEFLKEDLHNTIFQKGATKLESLVHEECITRDVKARRGYKNTIIFGLFNP